MKVSYEHQGSRENEVMYVALDLGAVGEQRLEISLKVKDLIRAGKPEQVKSVIVMIGESSIPALR